MNIFYKVTLQSLKKNKTRTIVTVIGIILSAAMICAVTTFASSMQSYALRSAIYNYGDWHGSEVNADYTVYEKLQVSSQVEQAIYLQQVGYALAEGCQNEYKPYLYVLGGSEGTEEMLSVHITAGRYPASATEILLPNHLEINGGVKHELGDTITLELGERVLDGWVMSQKNPNYVYVDSQEVLNGESLQIREKRIYTVVGFYDRPSYRVEEYTAPGYTAITLADEAFSDTYRYDVYFKMKHAKNIYAFMEENGYTGSRNTDVLMFQGASQYDSFSIMLTSLSTIVIALIMFGSISLIYNAFSISVSERTKQFGLLSSVGATKRQLRKMVLFEALVVAVIGIPIGVVSGIVGIGVTLMLIGNKFMALGMPVEMELSVSGISVVLAVLLALVTVLISAWIPSRRATKVSAVEAIRQNEDIKIRRRDVKTSKLTFQLFGLPGMLAGKHYKRNKRKYRTTVMSLFMSIVLFVSASAFTDYLMESVTGGFGTNDYDLWFAGATADFGDMTAEDILELFQSDPHITHVTYRHEEYFSGQISSDCLNEGAIETIYGPTMEDGGEIDAAALETVSVYGYVNFIPDSDFKELLKQYHLDEEVFLNPEEPLAITIDGNVVFNRAKGKFSATRFLKSDVCEIDCTEYTLKSGKTIYEIPYYIRKDGSSYFHMIYPVSMYEAVLPKEITEQGIYYRFCMKSDDHAASYENLKSLLADKGLNANTLYDYAASVEENRNLVTIIQVFAYGFIILISLIAAANVFNTISTNISLRRREFAMLKSVGMTARGFNRMMNFECLLYGSKALLFGLPVSGVVTFLIYLAIMEGYETNFYLPWKAIGIAVLSVFLVVFATMMYAMNKIKKENPIDALKNENL